MARDAHRRQVEQIMAAVEDHLDTCKEGSSRVPEGFNACCSIFDAHTTTCPFDVRYEWWGRKRGWHIVLASSEAGAGVTISFCPHCGKEL